MNWNVYKNGFSCLQKSLISPELYHQHEKAYTVAPPLLGWLSLPLAPLSILVEGPTASRPFG